MKNRFLLLLLLYCFPVLAQQKFVPDAYGHVADAAFIKLIADRHYNLVGTFVTVSKNPDVQYAKVCLFGKWGFIDTEGIEVIKPQYFFISDFKDGLAIAVFEEYVSSGDGGYDDVGDTQIVNRYVFINLKGERVSQNYDHANPYDNGLAIVNRGGRKGVIDRLGIEVIAPGYSDIYVQDSYILASTQDRKWGAFTGNAKPLVPFIYDNLRWFNGFLLGYTGNSYGLLHPDTGKPLSKELYINTNVHDQNNNYRGQPIESEVLVVCNNKGCFLVNQKGRRISDIYEGGITQASDHYYRVSKKSRMGLIDCKGKEVLACNYIYTGPYEDGTMFFAKKGEVVSYFSHNGKQIDVSAYETVGNFSNGRAFVRVNGSQFGFIDYSGKLVIPAIYDHLSGGFEFDAQEAAVRKEGKWGIINRHGEIVAPFIYDELYPGYKCYYTAINHQRGLLDDSGKELISPQYQSIAYIPVGNGLAQAQYNDKWGIIDLQNNVLIPFEYDHIERDYIDKGLVKVEKDGLSGIVNLQGKVLVPITYDILWSIDDFGAGLIAVEKDYRQYLADFYGHEYSRPKIDE